MKQNKRGWLEKLFGMKNSSVWLNGCPELEILDREKEKKLLLEASLERDIVTTQSLNQQMRQSDFLLSSKELPGHLLIKDFMWGLRRECFCTLKNKLTIKYASKYIKANWPPRWQLNIHYSQPSDCVKISVLSKNTHFTTGNCNCISEGNSTRHSWQKELISFLRIRD